MKESEFQIKFNKWLRHNFIGNGAFELKVCRSKSFPFSMVAEHQLHALKVTKRVGIIYKIADEGIVRKPYDCFKMQAPSFVVLMFYRFGQKQFFMIDIDTFLAEIIISERKSLTEDRARDIALYVGHLN